MAGWISMGDANLRAPGRFVAYGRLPTATRGFTGLPRVRNSLPPPRVLMIYPDHARSLRLKFWKKMFGSKKKEDKFFGRKKSTTKFKPKTFGSNL
jgi:hypothetical protein